MIKFLGSVSKKEPASMEDIINVENDLNVKFPSEYIQFLQYSDGMDGVLPTNVYVSIWSIKELIGLNTGYEVNEFAPHLLLFGSDGGDTAYAFCKESNKMPILKVPLIGLGESEAEFISESFNDFLMALR